MVRDFTQNDIDEIITWSKNWETNIQTDLLPKEGGIVPGLVAYFLYQTDSKICFMENLISNPKANKEEVRKAMDELMPFMIKKAKDKGFSFIYACSNNPRVIERAFKHNANVDSKYALITLPI